MKFAVIGFGARGILYAESFLKHVNTEITAICDTSPERLKLAKKMYNLPDGNLFLSSEDFFSAGKLADLCVVSTQDRFHLTHSIAALNKDYDLLLEKPIATTEADCDTILKAAQKLKRKIFVCHVLRYAPFFRIIKTELDSGNYGKPATINLTENVAYWHQAHSYVRGNHSDTKKSSPMIIAKSCHDLDIIAWLVGTQCKAVSSMGSLGYYKRENAPEGSGERCLDCSVKTDCPYDAERFYIKERAEKGNFRWPVDVLATEPTIEKLYAALKNGPWGRCVYKCENDAVDRQIVNMEFINGITAHLTMTAFSKNCYRSIHVHCEKGEIYGNMNENTLYCNIFGLSSKNIDVAVLEDKLVGHGGGDDRFISDIVNNFNGKPSFGLTSIELSMMSHKIGFCAERSRLKGGEKINL